MQKRRIITIVLMIICVFSLSIGLFGCNCKGTPPTTFDFELVKTKVELEIDSTYQIVIKGGETNGVTYLSENPLVASVSSDGLVVGESVGTTKVNVTLNNVTKTIEVQVIGSGEMPHIKLYNVPENESLRLLVNGEYEIESAVLFNKSIKNATVEFVSSDASKVVVDGNKLKGIATGKVEIEASAQYKEWCAKTTFSVEVVENVVVYMKENNIELSYSDITGLDTQYCVSEFSVTIDGQKVNNPELLWTSTDNSVATVVDGVITAIKKGDVEIRAIYTKNGVDYWAYANVSVVEPYLRTPKNVTYDKDTTKITWDAVEYADYYKVSIDGEEITVSNNQCVLGTDGSYFGQYEVKVRASSNNSGIVDSQNAKVEVLVDTILLDERFAPKDSYIDATIFEEEEYNSISGEKVYSVKKGDDDPFYDAEQFGYMFRKLYYTPSADKASSISGWTNYALIGVDEQTSKYKKATISFWAYAYEETTFRLLYTDMGKDKSILGESKILANEWTRVELEFSDPKTFKFISFLSSTGDFFFTDMRINLASYVGEDHSDCTFPINNGYGAVNMLINHVKNSVDAENLQPSDYHVIYGAIKNYEALSNADKDKVNDFNYIERLNEKFLKLYQVEVVFDATQADDATANTDQIGETGATMTYETNMLYGSVVKITNVGGVQQRTNIRIRENHTEKYEGYKLYFNLFSEQSRNVVYVNGSIMWTDTAGIETPAISAGQWMSFSIDSLNLGIYQDNRHIGITRLPNNSSFKLSAVFAIKMTEIGQMNAKILELDSKENLEASDYHVIYGIKTNYASMSPAEQAQVDYATLLKVETKFLKKYEVKVVFGATEAENGVVGDTSGSIRPTVTYGKDYVYGNLVKLTSNTSNKTYAIITANADIAYAGYNLYFNILCEENSSITYVNGVGIWETSNCPSTTAGEWTTFNINSSDMYRIYNGGRHIAISSLTGGKAFSISAVFAIRELSYDGDGKVVFGNTFTTKGITVENSDTWGANETISVVSSGSVISNAYTYDGTYGDVVRVDCVMGAGGNPTNWAVKVDYQSILDAIISTKAESVTVNIWVSADTSMLFGGFSGGYINLSGTEKSLLTAGWNAVTITKADVENIISKGVSLICNDWAVLPLTLLVSDFYLNYAQA